MYDKHTFYFVKYYSGGHRFRAKTLFSTKISYILDSFIANMLSQIELTEWYLLLIKFSEGPYLIVSPIITINSDISIHGLNLFEFNCLMQVQP